MQKNEKMKIENQMQTLYYIEFIVWLAIELNSFWDSFNLSKVHTTYSKNTWKALNVLGTVRSTTN